MSAAKSENVTTDRKRDSSFTNNKIKSKQESDTVSTSTVEMRVFDLGDSQKSETNALEEADVGQIDLKLSKSEIEVKNRPQFMEKDNQEKDTNDPEIESYAQGLQFYFGSQMLTAVSVSVPTGLFVYLLSLLPWSSSVHRDPVTGITHLVPNIDVTMIITCLAFVTFGPMYITGYTCLIAGFKQVLSDSAYTIHTLIHCFGWPVVYLLVAYINGFFLWFYYVDFLYFVVTFLPISFWVSFRFLHKHQEDLSTVNETRHPTMTPATQMESALSTEPKHLSDVAFWKTRRFRFALVYSLVEFSVIVSALSYNFMIFPIVVQFDDAWKILWRLFVHPVWFEVTMLLPQRLLVYHMPCSNPYLKVLPLFHASYHTVMFSRMLLLSVQDSTSAIYLNFLCNALEIVFRLTVLRRDRYVMDLYERLLKRCGIHRTEMQIREARKEDKQLNACIVNTETLFELIGILITPVLMICFAPFGSLFTFNSTPTSYGVASQTEIVDATITTHNVSDVLVSSAIQLVLEILTDMLCQTYEARIHKLPLVSQWKQAARLQMIVFWTFGICTMGVLGSIYTGLNLPRAISCTDPIVCR